MTVSITSRRPHRWRASLEGDASLRALQNHVLAILMGEEAVREALEDAVYADQRTIFTPDELQALIDATRP